VRQFTAGTLGFVAAEFLVSGRLNHRGGVAGKPTAMSSTATSAAELSGFSRRGDGIGQKAERLASAFY
jgi:hypothetical protein